MRMLPGVAVMMVAGLGGCAAGPEPAPPAAPLTDAEHPPAPPVLPKPPATPPPPVPPAPPSAGLREVFPHVRIDLSAKAVEFDATTSPLLVEDPRAPLMFLEAIACTPDTREHEALVVSKAKPSHIHAAMLLVGLVPGEPGGWRMEGEALEPVDPKGPRVKIELAWRDADGTARAVDPLAWVVSARGGVGIDAATRAAARLDGRPGPWWVFAGSRMTRVPDADGRPREVYDADESGVVIGLATFGAELVAFARTFSPDASVAEPEWVVDFSPGPPIAPVPPPGTAVLVRITAQ